MLPLIRTLFDITLLRKGPEAIPRAWFLFVPILAMWLFAVLAAVALIDRYDETSLAMSTFSAVIGVLCYVAVILAYRRSPRMTQTIAAIIGCGALIFLAFVVEYVVLQPLVSDQVNGLIANLILLWSVPVEGHIIARAIDRHWYVGILIAIAVFVVQLVIDYLVASTH